MPSGIGGSSLPSLVRAPARVARTGLCQRTGSYRGHTGSNEGRTGRVASASGRHVALLLDLGSLTAQVAQVVQLGATHVTAGDDLDLLDDRAVQREGALDTDAEADLANGVGPVSYTHLR